MASESRKMGMIAGKSAVPVAILNTTSKKNSEIAMMKCSMLHRQTDSRLSTVYQAMATRFSSGTDCNG